MTPDTLPPPLPFWRETLLLFYDANFRPSKLQARLNASAPEKEGDTSFWRLNFDLFNQPLARRFLAQSLVWWLFGPVVLWTAAGGTLPPRALLILSVALVLSGWGIAFFHLPSGLAAPVWLALMWGLQPSWWLTAQTAMGEALTPWLAWRTGGLALLAAAVCAGLGGGGGYYTQKMGHWRWTRIIAGVAIVVAGVVAGVVADGVAFGVVLVVAFGVAGNVADVVVGGVADVVVGGVADVVADVVVLGVVLVVAGIVVLVVAGVVAFGVAFGVVGSAAGVVAGVVAGSGLGFVSLSAKSCW